jgi:hypothetical protein
LSKVVSLDVFNEEEAERFLDTYGILDEKRRTEILHWSGRLPVLMSWLATPQGEEPDPSLPLHDIVERFLRWVTEPAWREIALLVAFPHTFNLDMLQMLLPQTHFSSGNILHCWRWAFNLAVFTLFLKSDPETQLSYERLVARCPLVSSLQEALGDLEELLAVQPQNACIPPLQQQLRARIQELEQAKVEHM